MKHAHDAGIKEMNSRDIATIVHIPGLCCAAEELQIREALTRLPTVGDCGFDLAGRTVTINHRGSEKTILDTLKRAGFPGVVPHPGSSQPRPTDRRHLIRLGLAFSFLIGGMVVQYFRFSNGVADLVFLVSLVLGGWEIALRALRSISKLRLDVNVLMTAAAAGAMILGDAAEGAAVLVLYALSLILESMSVDRSRQAISDLLSLAPLTAFVIRNGQTTEVAVESVHTGDLLMVRPGDRLPVDGVVEGGISSVDQSPVTGEALPAFKEAGSNVFAGTLNGRGSLEVRVTAGPSHSLVQRITKVVEDARARKTNVQTLTERFARVYVPGVFIAALMLAILPPLLLQAEWSGWFYRALTLLVISCPCALLLSTPMAVASTLTAALRSGVLIRGGVVLEQLARVKAFALDKTGTMTHGQYAVVNVERLDSLSEDQLLTIAAALEVRSEHPLAEALLREASRRGIPAELVATEGFEAIPGKGVRAHVKGKSYTLGNHHHVEDLGACSGSLERRLGELESQGLTVLVLTDEKSPLGLIALKDVTRMDASETVRQLRTDLGVRVSLITGDNSSVGRALAKEIGVDEVRTDQLPEEKLQSIKELQRRIGPVAMVGDGINDAPSLAFADVGIAVGGTGSDSAINAADVVLMTDRIGVLPDLVRSARRSQRIIRTNMFLALSTKAVFLVLGVAGISSLWLAILADDGVTLAVLLNSLRLLKFGGTRSKLIHKEHKIEARKI